MTMPNRSWKTTCPLVICYIAIENGPVEIVSWNPLIQHGGDLSSSLFGTVYQRVTTFKCYISPTLSVEFQFVPRLERSVGVVPPPTSVETPKSSLPVNLAVKPSSHGHFLGIQTMEPFPVMGGLWVVYDTGKIW
jgi:hypothetical protein